MLVIMMWLFVRLLC